MVGTKVIVSYSGVDITEHFMEAATRMIESLPPLLPTWEGMELSVTGDMLDVWWNVSWRVRPRVFSRQSCLLRNSFDWRNRKRGHIGHR